MRRYDIFTVRFLPFFLYILLGISMHNAANGVDDYILRLLHSQSAFYAFALYIISLSNKKYHCVYNRAMYIYLFVVPLFNFLDGIFDIIPCVEVYLRLLYGGYILTAIITAILAINHFFGLKIGKIWKILNSMKRVRIE